MAFSAAPLSKSPEVSVDYDAITGRPLRAFQAGSTQGWTGTNNRGMGISTSPNPSVNYDTIADRAGHNVDSDACTAMGIEIKERFSSMQAAFLKCDRNHDGRITKKELMSLCKDWNIPQTEAERVLKAADLDHNGTLSFAEFAQRFDPFEGNLQSPTVPQTHANAAADRPIRPASGWGGDNRPITSSGWSTDRSAPAAPTHPCPNKTAPRPASASRHRPSPRTQIVANANALNGTGAVNAANGTGVYYSKPIGQADMMRALFKQNDRNGDGVISLSELRAVFRCLGEDFGDAQIRMVFDQIDSNHDGKIQYNEFIDWLHAGMYTFGDTAVAQAPQAQREEVLVAPPAPATLPVRVERQDIAFEEDDPSKVYVYGCRGDSSTNDMLQALNTAGISYVRRDFDADKRFEKLLRKSGVHPGKARPPVVTLGAEVWFDQPNPCDIVQVPFAPTVALELRHRLGGGSAAVAGAAPVRVGADIDTEIAERFTSMQEAFLKIDEDRDGKITVRELLSKCQEWNIAGSEAQRIVTEADINLDKALDFNEFAIRFNGALPFGKGRMGW